MKKKIIIISAVAITIIIVAVLGLTNMFTKSVLTGKLYRVDNVYEEIWNMVISEKDGKKTILTASSQDSYVDYDFGFFEQINIKMNDDYSVVLCFKKNESNQDELNIVLFENADNNNDAVQYVYNYQSNTLYGNRDEAYLINKFLSQYYLWASDSSKFNPENNGDYIYKYEEYPLSHK